MRHADQVALALRALRHIDEGTSERGAPSRSPRARYLDPARFERERACIVREHPVAVAPAATLAQPGETLALDVAGLPLLLTRDADGTLNAFVNACRHRGARLADPGASVRRAVVCPYHSWTYGLDGALRGRPHEADFPHAPASECALARVPVAQALGLVWVVPRPVRPGEAPLDITTRLGRFADDLRGFGYDGWVPFFERRFECAANWKLPFEGNLETYHFQYAHRTTIAELFFDNLTIADHDGPHHRLFLPKRSIVRLREQPRASWDLSRHANIIYCFFPCTFVLHEGDHANLFTVLPEAVDRCTVIGVTLVPEPPATEKAERHWRRNVESFWGALDEDFALAASIQSTLASGAQDDLLLGASEWCAARFHEDVERRLD